MSEILFVKTSSLGDVIHHMPALTDARRHLPRARFSWMVEEDYAPLVRLHPAIDEVIPVATRRWRGALFARATWAEIKAFKRTIRARDYAEVIDSQGLLRSAFMVRKVRGRHHGYDRDSIREPLACRFYDVRHAVSRDLHAIRRNRILTGLALGYVPDGAIDYGLSREKFGPPGGYGLLLHATTRPEKLWPQESWIALGNALQARGLDRVRSADCEHNPQRREKVDPVRSINSGSHHQPTPQMDQETGVRLVLPWGTAAERQRGEMIAAAVPGAEVPDHHPIDAMARLVACASFVVGVDTGLVHLAAAFGVPLVSIFVSTKPGLTGPMGSGPIAVVGGEGAKPSVDEVMEAVERVLTS